MEEQPVHETSDQHRAFDDYYEEYNTLMEKNLRIVTPKGNISYFAEHKMAIFKKLVKPEPARILEYGCGIGNNLPFLRQNFPGIPIWGCDTSEKSLEIARQRFPDIRFFLISGEGTGDFRSDCILVADVIHHIPGPFRDHYMKKILGFLEAGGEIVFFEHNPYNPLTRFLVSTCPFDDKAELLSLRCMRGLLRKHGLTVKESGYCFYFPEFLRYFDAFEHLLTWIPLGGKYYVHAVRNS